MYALRSKNLFLVSLLMLCASTALAADSVGNASSPASTSAEDQGASTQIQPIVVKTKASEKPVIAEKAPARNRPVQRMDRSKRPAEHVVRKGDWLSKIAVRYGMSVEEIMSLNGLADDGIDIGSTLRLRARKEAPKAASKKDAAVDLAPGTSAPQQRVSQDDRPLENAEAVTEDSVSVAPEDSAQDSSQEDGLTAAQLVGTSGAEEAARELATEKANVTIPTPNNATVNPLSRARIALAIALVVLGLLSLHPRSRAVITARLPGLSLGAGNARAPLGEIEMHASRRVGASQQMMLLEVLGTRLLVGVSDGRMDVLHRWNESVEADRAEHGNTIAPQPGTPGLASLEAETMHPNDTSTVRQQVVTADETETAPMLTPSAEQLLDTWRDSVTDRGESGPAAAEEMPWWMEGATNFERSFLSDDNVESVHTVAPETNHSMERDQVEESILATLRNRRVEEQSNVRPSAMGSKNRVANAHGGFRAAARLGRRPHLPANQRPSQVASSKPSPGTREQKESGNGRARSGSKMSFQL